MRRTLLTAACALALLFAVTVPAGAVVAAPPNDDLANAQVLSGDAWAAWIDMTGATLEPGEPACGDTLDQSVWYEWSIPTSAEVGIGIAGVQDALFAGVYGPFDAVPASVTDLPDPLYCIYGVAPGHGLSETYEAGTYLVQLLKDSTTDFTPGMSIEKRFPFMDITESIFRWDITWLFNSGITSGCGGDTFCPDLDVTRGQMAAFLDRALHLASTATDYFTDDDSSIFEASINRLAASGITKGCTPTTFCPDATITREQMAAFLDRALHLASTATDYFTDDDSSIFEASINRLAASGITKGCTATTFCGSSLVTREQMAAFLHRAFG